MPTSLDIYRKEVARQIHRRIRIERQEQPLHMVMDLRCGDDDYEAEQFANRLKAFLRSEEFKNGFAHNLPTRAMARRFFGEE